jgi:hypothetical protein
MKKLNLPDEQAIKTYIEEIYVRSIEAGTKKAELHTFFQDEIAALASEFYLAPEKEFVLPNFRGNHHNGYIDVVWAIGSIPIVAIEIDSALREKSVKKLLASNANLLFWVYYGNLPFEPLVNAIDIAGRINVLHFSSKFRVKHQSPKSIEVVDTKPSKSYSVTKIRTKYPNAYEKWSSKQDELLKGFFEKGLSVSEMANKLQRKSGAIRSRIKKLGLR